MHIIYAAPACTEKTFQRLFAKSVANTSFQAQKYHLLLIRGLAEHTPVEVVATPPMSSGALDRAWVRIPRETEGNAAYHTVPAVGSRLLRMAAMTVGNFCHVLLRGRRDSVVILDILNAAASASAMAAAKLRRIPCVGIVTDLPECVRTGKPYLKITDWIIRSSDGYVFLTRKMNDLLNPRGKPYVILEGHSDIAMRELPPDMGKKQHPRVVLYAGGVSARYGLDRLVKAFRMVPGDVRLHIYGPGDYVPQLQKEAEQDPRIVYGGTLLSSQIVEKEQQAALLVNPRPTDERFVHYSFPSKTMEYMASGTPVLTTVLPGMPEEYYPYVYLMPDETPEGMARRLREVLGQSDEELFRQGGRAREFILNEKNNSIQGRRLLELLEALVEK